MDQGIGRLIEALNCEALYWEHQGPRAIRSGNWKLVGAKNSWKLFDLENDPIETNRPRLQTPMWKTWAKRMLVK